MNGIWVRLGAISYPLYITHNPLLRIVSNLFRMEHFHSPAILVVALITTSIAFAWLLLRLYDEPSRAWLQSSVRGLESR